MLLCCSYHFKMALPGRIAGQVISVLKPSEFTFCVGKVSASSCRCSTIQSQSRKLTLGLKKRMYSVENTYFSAFCVGLLPLRSIRPNNNRELLTFSAYINPLSRSNSTDVQTDFDDIKHLLKLKLEEKNTKSDDIDKQLGLLDMLFEHRLEHIDASSFREEAKKLEPSALYKLASDIFSLQDKVGEEAALLSGPLFRHAAIAGDVNAKYSYAQLMRTGQAGIDPDPKEAATLLSELAKEGHPFAQMTLADMYYSGVGVIQNFETAYTLYQIAAENGVWQGYSMLGKMYLQGQSVSVDYNKAVDYFRKGANQGDVQAYMSLAHCYTNEKGVKKDHKEAYKYHEMAAKKGYAPAIYNLGAHYFAGRGVELDIKKAADMFQKAADMGFAMAEINLGNMYYHGLGVEKDWHKAHALYKKAAPNHHNARLLLEELEDEMKKNGMTIKME